MGRHTYRAFGQIESHTGSSETPFTFVGRQQYYRDAEISLYLLSARHYDPARRHQVYLRLMVGVGRVSLCRFVPVVTALKALSCF